MKALPRTHSTTFGSIGPNAPKLFSVADGVTLDAALETASNLTEGVLDIARGVACQIDRADGAAGLWAGIHALESVAAILEAIQAGLLDLEHPEPTAAPCAKPDPADDPEVLRRVLLPDGSPYVNDDKTWEWMSEQALKAARFLGYVSWDALRDARNAPPQVFRLDYRPARWTLATGEVGVWLPENLEPRLELTGNLYRQPWQQIIIAEKQGVSDVLLPLAERYQATLALPGGELSDQMLYDMLKVAHADGRPVAIHQLGDFDPAGNQMAVSTARTAQALRDSEFPDLVIHVHAVALSLEHCQEWRLPSTPLKETERRASRWQAAMGWEQTELDAAVALAAHELTDVVKNSLDQYFDAGLAWRARQIKRELEEVANIRLAEQLNQETLAAIRYQAELKLGELNALVAQVNESLRFDPDEAGIRLPDDPPALIGEMNVQAEPLYDSEADWSASTLRLIERKRYGEDDMEEAA